eukprot:765871-Hanusia_phi.AAC.3
MVRMLLKMNATCRAVGRGGHPSNGDCRATSRSQEKSVLLLIERSWLPVAAPIPLLQPSTKSRADRSCLPGGQTCTGNVGPATSSR